MATKKKATRKRSTTKKRATKKKAAPRKKAAAKRKPKPTPKPKHPGARFRIGGKFRLDGQLLKVKRKHVSATGASVTFILLDNNGKPIIDEVFGRQSRLPKTWIITRRLSEVRPA